MKMEFRAYAIGINNDDMMDIITNPSKEPEFGKLMDTLEVRTGLIGAYPPGNENRHYLLYDSDEHRRAAAEKLRGMIDVEIIDKAAYIPLEEDK